MTNGSKSNGGDGAGVSIEAQHVQDAGLSYSHANWPNWNFFKRGMTKKKKKNIGGGEGIFRVHTMVETDKIINLHTTWYKQHAQVTRLSVVYFIQKKEIYQLQHGDITTRIDRQGQLHQETTPSTLAKIPHTRVKSNSKVEIRYK